MEQSVGREEHAASLDERDRLNAEVLSSQQAVLRLKDQLKGVQEQVGQRGLDGWAVGLGLAGAGSSTLLMLCPLQ